MLTRTNTVVVAVVAVVLALAAARIYFYFRESFLVRVSQSDIEGRGVFADQDFDVGDIVEVCPVLVTALDEVSGMQDYVFDLGDDTVGVAMGYGSMYNHADDPHVEYTYDPETGDMTFTALRPIAKGEEITVSYGPEWWSTRDLRPSST